MVPWLPKHTFLMCILIVRVDTIFLKEKIDIVVLKAKSDLWVVRGEKIKTKMCCTFVYYMNW